MNAEILSVGTELLLGQIVNTNARDLAVKLSNLGINLFYQSVVGDNPTRLREALASALARADLVILTGGLGPTQDDLTKQTVADGLSLPLIFDEATHDKIKGFFHKLNRPMVESNNRQAYFPEGAIILPNTQGTAPGCIIEKDGKIIIMLPGPPKEMNPMFDLSVVPYLKKYTDTVIYSRTLRIFGMGESSVEERLLDMMAYENPTVAPYAKLGEVHLRVTTKTENDAQGEQVIAPVVAEIKNRLGALVYSEDDRSLAEVVGDLLIQKGITLATAESCTGGMLSCELTEIPGISSIYLGGVVAYSNQLKMQLLGVDPQLINANGAVSAETALEMAKGIRLKTGAAMGISLTGIAGPEGGTSEKPVGLVYLGISTAEKTWHRVLNLTGGRERIRKMAVLNALDEIRKELI